MTMTNLKSDCKFCCAERPSVGDCPTCGAPPLPEDYEWCGECGFDHEYEFVQAYRAHEKAEKRIRELEAQLKEVKVQLKEVREGKTI
jgi:predicted amidophosphoribosyltransferase